MADIYDSIESDQFSSYGDYEDPPTNYNICTDRKLHHLKEDPDFWKSLKVGDIVCGRPVNSTAQTMKCCGWPLLDDLMTDEGTDWMVCRCVECGSCGNIIKVDDPYWQDDMADYCSTECRDWDGEGDCPTPTTGR